MFFTSIQVVLSFVSVSYKALTLFLFCFSYSLSAMAETKVAESTAQATTLSMHPSDYFLQILLSLIFILLIIFFAAWFLKRTALVNGAADGQLKVLGGLSLGQREKVVILQVGKEQILVGVTTTHITKLHTLSEPIEVKASEPLTTVPFSAKLKEALSARQEQQEK